MLPTIPYPLPARLLERARQELGDRIAADAFRTGEFVLTSGQKSDTYIDGKQVTLAPALAWAAILILDAIKDDDAVAVGGMSVGADPIAAAVSAFSLLTPRRVNAFIVRKDAKGHGTRQRVEGPPLGPGDRVVVVEDVITTGGSSLQAIEAVEALGARVCRVVVLVDRLQGGREAIEDRGYPVTAFFTLDDIRQRAQALQA